MVCDTATRDYIEASTPAPRLALRWRTSLDKYSDMNRQQMERAGVWSDFQMAKAEAIRYALETSADTLFLDSDTIILDELHVEGGEDCQLGVSPQFIVKPKADQYGYYNGGMLWTNQRSVPDDWIRFTKTSRYYDQASIEDLAREYKSFEFGDHYNLQTWRFIIGVESQAQIVRNLSARDGRVFYRDRRLKFIHTHFNQPQFAGVNKLFVDLMKQARLWRELAIVHRVIHDKWVIRVPKQPIAGKYAHSNDSFRELPLLFKVNASGRSGDVDLRFESGGAHCWLEPNILLYDRPTLAWANEEVFAASAVLLGNGDVAEEGKTLRAACPNVMPWIFWPRRPMVVEKLIRERGLPGWGERETESVFIGNYENSVQARFRDTADDWGSAVAEFHNTAGSAHKFSQEEYLEKLRGSRFGLCLRGFGSKCHREVELMALGTVPVVTPEVSISSYMDPPREGEHYIAADSPADMRAKVAAVSREQWERMSRACHEWYMRNVHSSRAWESMIGHMLYDECAP